MTTEPEPTAQPDPATRPRPEASDDYGYDLVHEVEEALAIPVTRRRSPSQPMATGRGRDQDGDLGYDDVHDDDAGS